MVLYCLYTDPGWVGCFTLKGTYILSRAATVLKLFLSPFRTAEKKSSLRGKNLLPFEGISFLSE